jgi:D-alanyl-D-alanine carboxypeptidase
MKPIYIPISLWLAQCFTAGDSPEGLLNISANAMPEKFTTSITATAAVVEKNRAGAKSTTISFELKQKMSADEQSIQALLDHYYPQAELPGAALAVVKDGKPLYVGAKGVGNLEKGTPLSINSTFRMASVSKQFTALAIFRLIQVDILTHNTRLEEIFKDLHPEVGQVTIGQLLNHTSGLWDYESLIPSDQKEQVTDADVLRWVNAQGKTYFPPGTAFRYSNTGFCILAHIVEHYAKIPYADFMYYTIFRPMGLDLGQGWAYMYQKDKTLPNRNFGYAMKRDGATKTSPIGGLTTGNGKVGGGTVSDFRFADQSITSATKGDGCVYISAEGYLKWGEAIRVASNGAVSAPITRDYINAILSHQYPVKDGVSYSHGGFVVAKPGSTVLFHSGETTGFRNMVYHHLEKGISVSVFANRDDETIGDLFEEVLQVLGEQKPVNKRMFQWMSEVY